MTSDVLVNTCVFAGMFGARGFIHWPNAGIRAIAAMHVPIIVASEARIARGLTMLSDICFSLDMRLSKYLVCELVTTSAQRSRYRLESQGVTGLGCHSWGQKPCRT